MIAYVDASVLLRVVLRQPNAFPNGPKSSGGSRARWLRPRVSERWIGSGSAHECLTQTLHYGGEQS
jgi:hypothetical protein